MMYLYAHTADGKTLFSRPVEQMGHETTRAILKEKFPGALILSPLETKRPGPISIITLYGSRLPDGTGRFTQLEQWGIQDGPPANPAGHLSLTEIQFMREKVYRLTFKHLIETTNISRPQSLQIAIDAADKYAAALEEVNRTGVTE